MRLSSSHSAFAQPWSTLNLKTSLSPNPLSIGTPPNLDEVSTLDKGNRYLPDIQVSAKFAGAIHEAIRIIKAAA